METQHHSVFCASLLWFLRPGLIAALLTTATVTIPAVGARAQAPGNVELSFDPDPNVTGAVLEVRAIALQPNGQVVLGSDYDNFNGNNSPAPNYLVRLNIDGSFDPSFGFGNPWVDGGVNAITTQLDGKLIVGGNYSNVNGISRNGIARLNPDGSLDLSFDPGTSLYNRVYATAVQVDGKVVIGGGFTDINGTPRGNIARLNADGSVDASFNPNSTGAGITDTLGAPVTAIAVQPDGKVIAGGNFHKVNGVIRNNLARFNADGSLDTNFDLGTGPNYFLNAVALQPDGRVVIGGEFSDVNGVARYNLARLNPDGSVDLTFNAGDNFVLDNQVSAVVVQPNGKLLVSGFSYSQNPPGIVRLNADGSPDNDFRTVIAGGAPYAIMLRPDGGAFVAGRFSGANGVARNNIALLYSNANAPVVSLGVDATSVSRGAGQTATVTFTRSSNGDLSQPLKMTYTVSSPLVGGSDYVALRGCHGLWSRSSSWRSMRQTKAR